MLPYTERPIGGAVSPVTPLTPDPTQSSEIGYRDRPKLDNTVSSHFKINRQGQVSEEKTRFGTYITVVCIQLKTIKVPVAFNTAMWHNNQHNKTTVNSKHLGQDYPVYIREHKNVL